MSKASHMVGSDTPATSINLNLATAAHPPSIKVSDYGDAILVTFGLQGTTVVLHLTAEVAAELARELSRSLRSTGIHA